MDLLEETMIFRFQLAAGLCIEWISHFSITASRTSSCGHGGHSYVPLSWTFPSQLPFSESTQHVQINQKWHSQWVLAIGLVITPFSETSCSQVEIEIYRTIQNQIRTDRAAQQIHLLFQYSSLSQNLIIYYVTSWFFFSMWLTREELYIQLFLVTQAWNLQIFIQNPRGNSQKNDGDCEGIQPKNALHSGLGIIGKSPRYLMFHIFAKELRNTFTNASFSLLLPFVQPCLRLARWNRIHWERSTGKRAKIKAVWRKTSLVSSVQNWVSFFLPNFCCLVCLIEFLP